MATTNLNPKANMLASSLFKKKVVDEGAETTNEICEKTGMSERSVSRKINAMLKSGQLEQVWKRVKNRLVAAYRIPKR